MDNFQALSVTYEALEDALLKLGFSLTITERHRLYYQDAKESIFGLALNITLDQKVRPAHLLAARHAIVAMGVSDEATFRRLLTAPRLDSEVPRHATANGHAPHRSHAHKSHVTVAPSVEAH